MEAEGVTTLTTLDAEYADLLRVSASSISAADAATLTSLARGVDAGTTTLPAATSAVARLAINTTDVALLSYQFFTGTTPYQSGLDYLVSPTGGNANNLNSNYYQSFNAEDRFIDFAVNLGKNGEGSARFTAAYGSLSLSDTATQAYTTIFGFTPSASQVSAFLNDQVANGLGGTETRAQYFAYYGLDGLNGIGAKAALVGWLLSQAAQADVGTYAKAADGFLADLAPDGLARFHVDLVQAYGPQAASAPGATITFSPSQSASPTSTDPALRSTNNADTITGTGGLNPGFSVATGDGNDVLTIPGLITGAITLGNGNDTVTLGTLGYATYTTAQGATATSYGSVSLGSGNDTVYLSGMSAGTRLSAAGQNNVLHLTATSSQAYASAITGVQTISGFQTIYVDTQSSDFILIPSDVLTIYDDVPSPAAYNPQTTYGAQVSLSEAAGQSVVLQNTSLQASISTNTTSANVFLDHFTGAPSTPVVTSSGTMQTGGAITFVFPLLPAGTTSFTAVATVHVSTDSTAGLISGYAPVDYAGSFAVAPPRAPLTNLVITGAGSLTAQISSAFTNVDASGGGDSILTYSVAPGGAASGEVFRFSNGTDTLNIGFGAASAFTPGSGQAPRLIVGLGADTLVVTGPTLANLLVTSAQTVPAPAEIDGYKKGVDHLVLDAVTTTLTTGVQTYVGSATTLTQALTNVSSHVAANTGAVFEFGGDTYVYQQDATVGVNTGDGLIRLVGVTGLSTASGSGVGDIHVHG